MAAARHARRAEATWPAGQFVVSHHFEASWTTETEVSAELSRSEIVALLKRKPLTWLPIAAIVVGSAAFSFWLRSNGLPQATAFPLGIVGGVGVGAIVDAAMLRIRLELITQLVLKAENDG